MLLLVLLLVLLLLPCRCCRAVATAAAADPPSPGDGSHIALENCRNYAFTQNLTSSSACEFELFRSTEDNAPVPLEA